MMDLCFNHRAEDLDHKYLDASEATSARIILTCTMPLSEIVTDFFDKLKSRSSGFASFESVYSCFIKRSWNLRHFIAMKMPDTRLANYRR